MNMSSGLSCYDWLESYKVVAVVGAVGPDLAERVKNNLETANLSVRGELPAHHPVCNSPIKDYCTSPPGGSTTGGGGGGCDKLFWSPGRPLATRGWIMGVEGRGVVSASPRGGCYQTRTRWQISSPERGGVLSYPAQTLTLSAEQNPF